MAGEPVFASRADAVAESAPPEWDAVMALAVSELRRHYPEIAADDLRRRVALAFDERRCSQKHPLFVSMLVERQVREDLVR